MEVAGAGVGLREGVARVPGWSRPGACQCPWCFLEVVTFSEGCVGFSKAFVAFPSECSESFLDFVKAPCWFFGFPDLPKNGYITHFTRVRQFFEASVQTCGSACEARPAVCHGRAQAREETVAVWAGGHVRVVECIRWSRPVGGMGRVASSTVVRRALPMKEEGSRTCTVTWAVCRRYGEFPLRAWKRELCGVFVVG